MTKYDYFELKKLVCLWNAQKKNDENLKRFYLNASHGFEIKQKALTVEEANEWETYL